MNHPIDESSPLYGLTEEDLRILDAEFLILIKGFDDAFAQIVHSRSSYRHNEIVWDARFNNIFVTDEEGAPTLELDRISDYDKVKL